MGAVPGGGSQDGSCKGARWHLLRLWKELLQAAGTQVKGEAVWEGAGA